MNKLLRFFRHGLKSLKRERFFAVVNVFGLTLGMFCFLITSLYVKDELTHDKWHQKGNNVYVPKIRFEAGRSGMVSMLPPFAAAKAFVDEIPGVLDAVKISMSSDVRYKVNEQWFDTKGFYHSEPSLFNIFDFKLALGDVASALTEPNTVIISSELATKHFEGLNPIGELIELKDKGTYKVTGVLAPIPGNSHLNFDMLTPIDFQKVPYIGMENNWRFGMGLDYLLLDEAYSVDQLKADAKQVVNKHSENVERAEQYAFDKFTELYLSNLTFRGNAHNSFGGSKQYIYIFSLVGIMLLLVASFNYINLTTARSFARSKDMAVKKVIGASRLRLVLENIGETLFLTIAALIIALIALEVSLPQINDLLGKKLELDFIGSPDLLFILAGLLLIVVAASGVYPAVVSSTFNISSLLKGASPKSKSNLLRKSLVVFQFLICAGLLASALIIRGQANHLMTMDVGYNAKNILSIDVFAGGFGGKYDELRTELERIPQIEMVSGSPLPEINSITMIPVKKGDEEAQEMLWTGSADNDFIELFDLEMVSGQSLKDLDDSERSGAVLINEAAVRQLNLDDPIGHELVGGMTVKGVVKDFHYQSGKNEINPMLISNDKANIRNIHFRFREGDRASVLAQVEEVWNSFDTGKVFEVEEVEGFFAASYQKEEALVNIFDVLTVMLILVAFLGLFALTAFENQLRERELSIRKVLGASSLSLIRVMNQRFVLLIVIALLVSIPITQALIRKWLSDFPYRIDSTAPYFIITFSAIVLVTLVVLSIHGYSNTRKNPVDILRNE